MATQFPPRIAFRRTAARIIILGALLIICLFPVNLFAIEILFGTGTEGTFSHFAGRAICRVISRHAADFDCRVIPAADDIHNLTNLQGGSLDIGLADNSALYDAANKKGFFEFLDITYDNLGILTPVYDQAILLVVRSDAEIDSLDQLKGKRINAGPPRSKTDQTVELIMGIKGWTDADFQIVEALPSSQNQDTMAFCHGSIQAMVEIGVHPDAALQKLVKLCSAVPVSMDDPDVVRLIDSHPAYSRIVIPPKVYPEFDQPVTTFGNTVSLVASGSLDDETVQAIMAALDQHQNILKNVHPTMGTFGLDKIDALDIGISLHPGAAAYLSQRGK